MSDLGIDHHGLMETPWHPPTPLELAVIRRITKDQPDGDTLRAMILGDHA